MEAVSRSTSLRLCAAPATSTWGRAASPSTMLRMASRSANRALCTAQWRVGTCSLTCLLCMSSLLACMVLHIMQSLPPDAVLLGSGTPWWECLQLSWLSVGCLVSVGDATLRKATRPCHAGLKTLLLSSLHHSAAFLSVTTAASQDVSSCALSIGVLPCAGEPGNEAGYVVKMTEDNLSPPYRIAPGTRVRIESAYLGTERRLGVMGLIKTWVAGLSKPCYREFGSYHYHHYFRPPVSHSKQ